MLFQVIRSMKFMNLAVLVLCITIQRANCSRPTIDPYASRSLIYDDHAEETLAEILADVGQFSIFQGDCKTTNGNDCVFPFWKDGIHYNGCVPDPTDRWCPYDIEDDEDITNKQYKWGFCMENCPTSNQGFNEELEAAAVLVADERADTQDGSLLPGQCRKYYTIKDRTRSVNHTGNPRYCDQRGHKGRSPDWSYTGWYRMIEPAGVQLPEYPPGDGHCGTYSPGWLKGVHPTTVGDVVDRTVCFQWRGVRCNWYRRIKITNCDDFYVYYLPEPPECYLRYCSAK